MVLVFARAGAERGIGWTYAAAAAQSVIADVLAGVVVARSVLDVPGAAEAMARAVRNIGRPGVAATAISAVDIALWDLKARLRGCSLAQLLGQARDSVPVCGSGGFTSYNDSQTREQLADWVAKDHIPRVKIKIGERRGARPPRDLERVALAREVIGPGTELYLDANGGYTAGQAIRIAAELGVAVPNLRHVEYIHDHQRIERMFFDGALHPDGAGLAPDPDHPGLGLALRNSDAERYRHR
jgi:L-alanine-DL-glutamate epimerase-like enolase superfamily enzyme